MLHQCKKQTGVNVGISEPVHFSILNATPLQCVIIKMGPGAPTIVLWSKLNMELVCKSSSHSVFVAFPLFILILNSKIDFFMCCSVYPLNLTLLSSFIWFVWSGLFEAEGFSCYICPFIPSLCYVLHPPPLSPEEG